MASINSNETGIKPILDACCGSRMMWFDKQNPLAVFADIRKLQGTACDGRKIDVNPDVKHDFREMDFPDESFRMVVFDPPHLISAGKTSWLAQKYGVLNKDSWKDDIKRGFSECFRVLEIGGFLVFKWNCDQVKLKDVLALTHHKPLFGHRRLKTFFLVFMKA